MYEFSYGDSLFMLEKSETNLRRLRRYIAEEAERLGKARGVVIHRINLEDLNDEVCQSIAIGSGDSLAQDVDQLFGTNRKNAARP